MTTRYPKPALLAGLPDRGHVVIEASAGTGKTYTLEHLVIELLLGSDELELEHLLIVTFTERATADLKDRVRKTLRRVLDAARNPSQPDQDQDQDEKPYWEITEAGRRKLERALASFDLAPIYTIHAFCQKVLTEYAFANRRLFDQHHVDFGPLFERAFTDTMRRTLATHVELQDWLEAWLEVDTVESLRELMSTTLLARAELWPRLREQPLAAGLERFGEDMWQRYRELYRRRCDKREAAFLRAQQSWVERRSVPHFLMAIDGEVSDFKVSLRELNAQSEEQRDFISFASSLIRLKPAVAQKLLPVIEHALTREKLRSGAYTFDDMLGMVWEGLQRPGSGEWLANTLRRKYRVALIDEFQDTDELQWHIFRHLFVESPSPKQRLIVIGDPKQAIYGFRNADVYTYIDACKVLLNEAPSQDVPLLDELEAEDPTLAKAHAESQNHPLLSQSFLPKNPSVKLHLDQNFRSTAPLIRAYNAILDQSATAPLFTHESIRYDHPVKCGDPSRALRDARGVTVAPVVLGAMKRREGENKPVRMDDIYACYGQWIASEIQHILSEEGQLTFEEGGEQRPIAARDIYVLTRTRTDEIRLEVHLRARQIPYVFVRQESLFATPAAREVYELLRAVERPRDRGRRLRAWSTPFFEIDLEALMQCRDVPETHPLYLNLLRWHALAEDQRFEELFTQLLHQSGLARRELFFSEDEQTLSDVQQILDALLEEAHLGRCDLSELLARTRAFIEGHRKPMSEQGDVRLGQDLPDAVQILTMHKSKGLEAPIVFLYPFGGMNSEYWRFHYPDRSGVQQRAMHILKPEDKLSPRLRKRAEDEERQESERLLYVALTRAKARLYLPFIPYIGQKPCCTYLAQRSYEVLNRRLRDLQDALDTPPAPLLRLAEGAEAVAEAPAAAEEGRAAEEQETETPLMSLFLRVEHPYFGPGNQDVTLDPEALATLSSWRPESLLATLPAHDPEAARRDQLRLAALAQSVESYSSLKRRHGGYQQQHAHQQLPDEQELRVEAELVSQEDAVSEDDLPGGVRTGLFLHELLETLDPASLTRYESFEEWGEDPDVLARFQRAALEHGLEPHLIPLASRVIWRALNAVVQVEHGVIYGLGHCLPNTHELEFLYPIPEAARDHLTSSSGLLGMGASASGDDTAPRVERGFIKGYIDYVFMWQGRIYLADWKSDLLDRYDPISLRAHFEHNYIKQGYLYSLAICKLLQINTPEDYAARFGCAVYCFLRGMQDDSSTGLVTWRPSWSQLQDFARALTEPGLGQQRAHLATPATHPLASRSS